MNHLQRPGAIYVLAERLKAAIEGECHGVAISEDTAVVILDYVLTGRPPALAHTRFAEVLRANLHCEPPPAPALASK